MDDQEEETNKTKINPRTPEPAASGGDLEEEDILLDWLSMDEDTIEELMKVLDKNETEGFNSNSTNNFSRVKFIENPYLATMIFQCSSSYITINGNEESCGSSFSDWEASVMASVDLGNVAAAAAWERLKEEKEENGGGRGGDEMVDGLLGEGLIEAWSADVDGSDN